MQSIHQNALLLLMLTVTGISVYLAIELRKRMNRADTLINSIECIANDLTVKSKITELPEKDVPAPEEQTLVDQPTIKIVQPRTKKAKTK